MSPARKIKSRVMICTILLIASRAMIEFTDMNEVSCCWRFNFSTLGLLSTQPRTLGLGVVSSIMHVFIWGSGTKLLLLRHVLIRYWDGGGGRICHWGRTFMLPPPPPEKRKKFKTTCVLKNEKKSPCNIFSSSP